MFPLRRLTSRLHIPPFSALFPRNFLFFSQNFRFTKENNENEMNKKYFMTEEQIVSKHLFWSLFSHEFNAMVHTYATDLKDIVEEYKDKNMSQDINICHQFINEAFNAILFNKFNNSYKQCNMINWSIHSVCHAYGRLHDLITTAIKDENKSDEIGLKMSSFYHNKNTQEEFVIDIKSEEDLISLPNIEERANYSHIIDGILLPDLLKNKIFNSATHGAMVEYWNDRWHEYFKKEDEGLINAYNAITVGREGTPFHEYCIFSGMYEMSQQMSLAVLEASESDMIPRTVISGAYDIQAILKLTLLRFVIMQFKYFDEYTKSIECSEKCNFKEYNGNDLIEIKKKET